MKYLTQQMDFKHARFWKI
ncbi:hypothetical protein AAHA92_22559 [Salvia divinorum]|uniref:Uncharacterized protein n=1 Tax=Salvia divinorum TaxID=28513 RepID=A0ABD1GRX4_SALDI